jgi:16S rRNA (guanine527-N7)-methyltransferase
VAVNNLTQTIEDRLAKADLSNVVAMNKLVLFIELLAKWNRKINLTSLNLEPASEEAIDRLIVEAVAASRFVTDPNTRIVDLGSGGGSPAIPFRSQLENASLRMVESRSRKCAFLREATRALQLENTVVEESRFELLSVREDLRASADLVTLRAVRIDEPVLELIRLVLVPGGAIFRFAGQGDMQFQDGLNLIAEHSLTASASGHLQILSLM